MDRPDYLLSPSTAGSNRPVLVLSHSLGTNFALWQSTEGFAKAVTEFLSESV
jgi:hypothetical protein